MFLGIDTSCYTTSVAIINEEEQVVYQRRELLPVRLGEKGLSQSEALFLHMKKLPELFDEIRGQFFCCDQVKAVCASVMPRRQEGSYMPVFLAAESIGRIVASTLRVPFFRVSHQENHLRAGLWSAGLTKRVFLMLHLSGGTTELLKVTCKETGDYDISLLGASADLHAGQFVDRVGVALGLPFPAGPHLEELAKHADKEVVLPVSVTGYGVSFSGPETAAHRLLAAGESKENIARAVELCIAASIERLLAKALKETQMETVLIVGGVAANQYFREYLNRLQTRETNAVCLHFAQPQYSVDHAIGSALLAKDFFIL